MKLVNSFLALALSATAAAFVALTLVHGAEASIAPQVLPCAAAAALRASFAPPLPLSSSSSSPCSGARCELSLVSLAGGASAAGSSSSSSLSFSAPLRIGINAVSVKGMEPGVWEATATCGRGCSVVAAVGGGEKNASTSLSSPSSSSSSPPSTARFPFLVQKCNGTFSQSMVEMEARFVVAEARGEAGKFGKSGVSSSSSSLSPSSPVAAAKGVRVAAATAALAASQVGLVALAVA